VSAKAPEPSAKDAPKPKGKGKLIVIILAVLVLAGGGGGGWFIMNKKNHAAEQDEAVAAAPAHAAAPTYMALENLVVNLADGERFAQIGITLELDSEKTSEKVKVLQPSIRSKILMLVSQRTAEELLKRDGKEKLATDIANEVSGALGYEVEDGEPAAKPAKPAKATKVAEADAEDEEPPVRKKKKKKALPPSPVHGVLFSAFIVQ